MNLEQMFDQVSISMRAEFQRTREAVSHPGLKGEAFEEIFRTFLGKHFPQFLAVAPGILIDTNGHSSRQLDAIVFDAQHTPVLFSAGASRVIPVECAYAVIEVKAKLDSNEIDHAFTNMKSVRALTKKAWRPAPHSLQHNLYGKQWPIWPVMYFVFAFDCIDLMSVARQIDMKHQEESLPEWSRIDTVCVLDKGVVLNRFPNGTYDVVPGPGSRPFVCRTPRALLFFYLLIFHRLAEATLPPFLIREYLMHVTWGPEQAVGAGLEEGSAPTPPVNPPGRD